jgi:hypothetical protein
LCTRDGFATNLHVDDTQTFGVVINSKLHKLNETGKRTHKRYIYIYTYPFRVYNFSLIRRKTVGADIIIFFFFFKLTDIKRSWYTLTVFGKIVFVCIARQTNLTNSITFGLVNCIYLYLLKKMVRHDHNMVTFELLSFFTLLQ